MSTTILVCLSNRRSVGVIPITSNGIIRNGRVDCPEFAIPKYFLRLFGSAHCLAVGTTVISTGGVMSLRIDGSLCCKNAGHHEKSCESGTHVEKS